MRNLLWINKWILFYEYKKFLFFSKFDLEKFSSESKPLIFQSEKEYLCEKKMIEFLLFSMLKNL